jgi:hypothetical protein
MTNTRTGPLTDSGPELTTNGFKSILPAVKSPGKRKRPRHRVWYPPPSPGQRFSEVRTIARANAGTPTCADLARVRAGDKFGHWTVIKVEAETVRAVAHGWPCQCMWGFPRSDAIPGICVPYTFTQYRMLCRCQCGTVRHVDPWNLINGQSFSCGCKRNDWQLKREVSRDSKRKAA